MASDQVIAEILEEIADAYPAFQPTEGSVKIWKKYLVSYDDDLLRRGVEFYISTSAKAFPPSIPEIRDAITQLRVQIAGIPMSLEAWEDVTHAKRPRRVVLDEIDPETGLQMIGTEEYQFIHPIVKKVAVMLGWPDKFPVSDEIGVDRAHFIREYEKAIAAASVVDREIPEVREFVASQRESGLILGEVKSLTKKLEVKK